MENKYTAVIAVLEMKKITRSLHFTQVNMDVNRPGKKAQ